MVLGFSALLHPHASHISVLLVICSSVERHISSALRDVAGNDCPTFRLFILLLCMYNVSLSPVIEEQAKVRLRLLIHLLLASNVKNAQVKEEVQLIVLSLRTTLTHCPCVPCAKLVTARLCAHYSVKTVLN